MLIEEITQNGIQLEQVVQVICGMLHLQTQLMWKITLFQAI